MKRLHFRGSIYVDFYIFLEDEGPEEARKRAQRSIEGYARGIPNSYIGGVATIEEIFKDRNAI